MQTALGTPTAAARHVPSGVSECPCMTVPLLMEGQDAMVFSEEETWTRRSLETQDDGMVGLEESDPLALQAGHEAQRGQGLA